MHHSFMLIYESCSDAIIKCVCLILNVLPTSLRPAFCIHDHSRQGIMVSTTSNHAWHFSAWVDANKLLSYIWNYRFCLPLISQYHPIHPYTWNAKTQVQAFNNGKLQNQSRQWNISKSQYSTSVVQAWRFNNISKYYIINIVQ